MSNRPCFVFNSKRTAIYSFTRTGFALAGEIAACLDLSLSPNNPVMQNGYENFACKRDICIYAPLHLLREEENWKAEGFSSISALLKKSFREFDEHIFIGACGLAVRILAPCLGTKETDPAVVVVDQQGRHVISLLSGHIGGANELALEIAAGIKGDAVITTATDMEQLPAPDVFFKSVNFKVVNSRALKRVNSALLEQGYLDICSAEENSFISEIQSDPVFQKYYKFWENRKTLKGGGIIISWHKQPAYLKKLVLAPPYLHVGIGCRRGISGDEITGFILKIFAEYKLEPRAIARLASIDLKINEQGLLDASRKLAVPCAFFDAVSLNSCHCPNPSAKAWETIKVHGVCEPAAMLSAVSCKLLLPKIRGNGITLAVAEGTTGK